jgi:hypothetical protein
LDLELEFRFKKNFDTLGFFILIEFTAESLSLSQKPQNCAKRRQKTQKGDFMAEKGVNRRIFAPFGELGKNIV